MSEPKTDGLISETDFPGDYVTKELATKICNEKFLLFCKANNICLHPLGYVKARLLSWQLKHQDLYCGVCGKSLEVSNVKPTLRVVPNVSPRSLSLVDPVLLPKGD